MQDLIINGNLNINGSIIPEKNNIHDIGTTEKKIRHIYTSSGSVYIDNYRLGLDEDNKGINITLFSFKPI